MDQVLKTVLFHLNFFSNKERINFSISTFFKTFFKHFDSPEQSTLFLHAHDTTISQIMTSLEFIDGECIYEKLIESNRKGICKDLDIPFSTYIGFELWRND